jgi:hypothetical protein
MFGSFAWLLIEAGAGCTRFKAEARNHVPQFCTWDLVSHVRFYLVDCLEPAQRGCGRAAEKVRALW